MKKNEQNTAKNKNSSTRNIILTKSLELINCIGVVDFRIDSLASSLSLSPGNITYHFSRKEDICIVLWEKFLNKLDTYDIMFSQMLDLKQSFLILRSICRLIYDYRGVVMFRGGDIRTIVDDETDHRSFKKHIHPILSTIATWLQTNGYINESADGDKEIENTLQTLIVRWWINQAAIEQSGISSSLLVKETNRSTLLLLFSFYPLFTEKGIREFEEITERVKQNDMDI